MPERCLRGVGTLVMLGVLGAGAFTGCGSSSSSSPTSSSTPAGGLGGLALSTRDVQRVRDCLIAAGLASALPSSFPTRALPTDGLTGSPKAYPSGGTGGSGVFGFFGDPRVRKALKACGITLPTRSAGAANPG